MPRFARAYCRYPTLREEPPGTYEICPVWRTTRSSSAIRSVCLEKRREGATWAAAVDAALGQT